MRKVLCSFVVLAALAGCAQPSKVFVDAIDSAAQVILPEYEMYVTADPALTVDQKANRKRTAQLLRDAIAEAKKE